MKLTTPVRKLVPALETIREANDKGQADRAVGLLRDLLRSAGKKLDLTWQPQPGRWLNLSIDVDGKSIHTLKDYPRGDEYIAMRDATNHVCDLIADGIA